MHLLPRKFKHNMNFDKRTLRKNDISLLILDERWNNLFQSAEKTPAIERSEENLRGLLKEESRLIAEKKEAAALKKRNMDKIIQLTSKVFEENDINAKKEMQSCEQEIKKINDRVIKIDELIEEMPDRLKQANLDLLELTVSVVYFKMRSARKRVEELEKLIADTRDKLKAYIDEKESLSQDDSDIYSYFHDLLGAQELQRLDEQFYRKGKRSRRDRPNMKG